MVAAFVTAVAAVGWAVGLLVGRGTAGLVVAAVLAGTATVVAWNTSDAVALRLTRARPAGEIDCARLHNLVEGMCIAGGLPKPRLYLVDDGAPNALALGRDPRHASLAVTTGLLDKLSRVELEGVLAHELSHIKSYDTRASTLAVTLVGLATLGRMMPIAVSHCRELQADVSSVSLTRYPPGLIAALEKLRDDPSVVHPAPRATAHLWIESPLAGSTSHPPIEERIAALREF